MNTDNKEELRECFICTQMKSYKVVKRFVNSGYPTFNICDECGFRFWNTRAQTEKQEQVADLASEIFKDSRPMTPEESKVTNEFFMSQFKDAPSPSQQVQDMNIPNEIIKKAMEVGVHMDMQTLGDWELVGIASRRTVVRLQSEVERLKKEKGGAYSERNNLVVFLSKQFESHLCRHPEQDEEWENDWRWIVCIHSPKGQITWHIHDSELTKFNHLSHGDQHWDGHTTEEKYKRLSDIQTEEKLWCAMFGTWGDHRSGTCPEIDHKDKV